MKQDIRGFSFLLVLLLASALPVKAQLDAMLHPAAVVATRGGVSLTVGLIDQEVARMPDTIRADYMEDPERMARLIDKLLLTKQLGVEAIRQGMDIPPEYQSVVVEDNLDALTAMANQLLRKQELLRTDAEYEGIAAERYRARKANYASEVTYHVRVLSIDRESRGDVAAKIVATAAEGRAQKGEDFAALIEELDDRHEGAQTTPVAYPLSQLMRAPRWLRDAVMALRDRPGLSKVLEDDGFYRIVQVTEVTPPIIPTFDEVRARIVNEVRDEAMGNAKTTLMRSFSLQDVELNPDVLQQLADRYHEYDGETLKGATDGWN